MGCDIHVYTERKLDDGTWLCCDHFRRNEYFSKYEDERKWVVEPIYDSRYYELFATLAGVRNYNDVKPIDNARGLPDNVSEDVKKEAEWWEDSAHTFSWFLASELFAYKAKRPFYKESGMISPTDAFYLDEFGKLPEEWCEYTSNESWVRREWIVPWSVLDGLVDAIKERMCEVYYIYDFLKGSEKEQEIAKHAKDFRIVFWFDS